MNNVTLSGNLVTIEKDIITILESSPDTGLHLNTNKCELIMEDFTPAEGLGTFEDFVRVDKEDMTLLGALVLKGKAQNTYGHPEEDRRPQHSSSRSTSSTTRS